MPRLKVLDVFAKRCAGGDPALLVFCRRVCRSLRYRGCWDGMIEEELPEALVPLHMPAIREMLGSLEPEHLHPDIDKAAGRGKDAFGPLPWVSQLKIGCWGVSVRDESMLARARLQEEALELLFCCSRS